MRRMIAIAILAALFVAFHGQSQVAQAQGPKSEPATQSATLPASQPAPIVGSDKNPARIPKGPAEIKVDGDGAEWDKIPAMPLPYMRKDGGSLKLCWNDSGLYGFARVKSAKIPPSSENVWRGDCISLWIEKDCARVGDRDDTTNATEYAFAPNPDNDKGEGTCVVAWGGDAADLVAAWKKTDDGFTIEFFVPAKSLAPAKMKAGTKVGLNFAVIVAGRALEQFYHNKSMDSSYRSPDTWGTAVFAE